MPAITVRNLPAETHRALKDRAKRNSRSTEAEIRAILNEAAAPEKVGVGTALYRLGRKYHDLNLDFERDKSPVEPAVFD
jgi:plasmid stability protein